MIVYPDGDALSDWECQMLEDIERDMESSDPRLAAFFSRGDPAPLYVLAADLVAAEAALAVTVLTVLTACVAGTMAGLATLGSSLRARSVNIS